MIFLIFQNFAFLWLYGHFFRLQRIFIDTKNVICPMPSAPQVFPISIRTVLHVQRRCCARMVIFRWFIRLWCQKTLKIVRPRYLEGYYWVMTLNHYFSISCIRRGHDRSKLTAEGLPLLVLTFPHFSLLWKINQNGEWTVPTDVTFIVFSYLHHYQLRGNLIFD